jgi:hypothetical protein
MARPDKRGNRTGEARQEHWTKMVRNMMETQAWRSLSPVAQALYPWFKFEWKGPKANNNGKIRLSVRQAARALGVTPGTAARAIHDLQAKGFLVMTEMPSLGIEGAAKSPAFELTEITMPGSERHDGRKLFKDWRPGADYPVPKVESNNPTGRNGKEKPVQKIRTATS